MSKEQYAKVKYMVLLCLIFLFSIGMTSLVFMFIATFHVGGWELWLIKGLYGGLTTSCIAGITAAIRSFFRTREDKEKGKEKIELKKEKNRHREEMKRIRYERGK